MTKRISTSEERLKHICEVYNKYGEIKAAELLGITVESLKRRVRESKELNIYTQSANNSQSKYLNKILETYSEAELKIIAEGKTQILEKSKKLNINFDGNRVRIGVMTDTHIGHQKFYEQRLFAAFEEFKKEKVDFVCHAGDVTEGMSHRPGHIYELTHLGYDQQKRYAVELFGQWTDTDIYAISGNHDRWYIKSNGANIVGDIDRELSNFHFIGHDEGDIKLNDKVNIRLWHGEDGNSYALSYRVQKILESLQGGDKPSIMFCGHTHKYVKLFERNVHAISIGCLEDQTPFMRGKRISANPGFGIYDITFSKIGIVKLREIFYPFY
jgi:predicted phosphodiesterase